jgi:signal transduction histidine kinase
MKSMSKNNQYENPSSFFGVTPAVPPSHFQIFFDSAPDPCLILDPSLHIVHANNAYVHATRTKLDEITGLGIFEAFPDNPNDDKATGVANLRASLARVLDKKVTDAMCIQKYDIPKQSGEEGFEERYWSPINTPVLDAENKIQFIIHRVVDVTTYIHLMRNTEDRHQLNTGLTEQTEQMAAEIFTRCEEVSMVNNLLKQAKLELKKTRDDLELQVAERTASLLQTNRKLQNEIDERKRKEEVFRAQQVKVQTLANELSIAEERERARIAGELHDHVGHRLLLGKMKIDKLAQQSPSDINMNEIMEITDLIDQSIQDIRSLTFQLRPPILSAAGLEAAVRWLGKELRENLELHVDFFDDKEPKPLKYEIRSALFQSIRELLQNVAKHAGTKTAKVSFKRESGFIVISVEDNGIGFDVESARTQHTRTNCFGLFNIEQRINYMDGCFILDSEPGKGTSVTMMVPLEKS